MTRRIDRVHELRRRDEPVMATERQQAVDAVARADLRDVLGIPATMELSFGPSVPERAPDVVGPMERDDK